MVMNVHLDFVNAKVEETCPVVIHVGLASSVCEYHMPVYLVPKIPYICCTICIEPCVAIQQFSRQQNTWKGSKATVLKAKLGSRTLNTLWKTPCSTQDHIITSRRAQQRGVSGKKGPTQHHGGPSSEELAARRGPHNITEGPAAKS
eukprot:1139715-Pelagomonas_calceolata.AAC.5